LFVRHTALLDTDDAPNFSPEAADGVRALVAVFNRACLALNLDRSDEVVPRKIARSIIEAAIAGESDPEVLYQGALKAVSN
jgi:hypothetical protein